MELKILSPQESGFVKEIQWNHEELKAEIARKMEEYKGLVFTEDTIREGKKDRANLNKLKTAFEDERKRIKKLCMEPYTAFEQQVKEVIALIDEPIRLIDAQIKEVEENRRRQKQKDIEELFQNVGFQAFVTLEQVFDSKWMNATVTLSSIEEQMKSRMFQIGNDVLTISKLPEFSFEAMKTYEDTLDLGRAIQEGQRLSNLQKRKEAYEAEQRRRQEEELERKKDEMQKAAAPEPERPETVEEEKTRAQVPLHEPETITIDFRVTATKGQLSELKQFLIKNKITYGPVPKKGEQ